MAFEPTPIGYTKGILSDLQGAWGCLRQAVVAMSPSEIQHKLIFHIDEAMSWESVRDLKHMRKTLVLITNIAKQAVLNKEINEWLDDIYETLNEILAEIKSGKKL
jgi:hypothetical protein